MSTSTYFEDKDFQSKSSQLSKWNFNIKKTRESSSDDDDSDNNYNEKPFFSTTNTSRSSRWLVDRNDNRKYYGRNIKELEEKDLNKNPEFPKISSTLEDHLTPELEKLTLSSDCELLNISELSLKDDKKLLAGSVTSVVKIMGLIVVKPPIPYDFLLHLGSPIFLEKSKGVKVGRIIDVFGPACEPYYCVKPVKNGIDLVCEGDQLSFSPNHPRTRFIRLKREADSRYNVLFSRELPLLFDDQKSNSAAGLRDDDEDFWSNNSRKNFNFRRRYQRGTINNRGTYGYRNKYKKNFLYQVRSKSSHY